MHRRDLMKAGLAAAATLPAAAARTQDGRATFQLHYAPSPGQFGALAGDDDAAGGAAVRRVGRGLSRLDVGGRRARPAPRTTG